MNEILNKVVVKQKRELDQLVSRASIPRVVEAALRQWLNHRTIKVVSGPRRAGKSSMTLRCLPPGGFGYLNFEDNLLPEDLDTDALLEVINKHYSNPPMYFFDEIQNLARWEQFLNQLQRTGKNIIVSGSNAKLLSSELATSLTGRHIEIPVWPFSFAEYVGLHGSNHGKPTSSTALESQFENYLQHGGYPEVLIDKQPAKEYLAALFDKIVINDLVKRKKIRRVHDLQNLLELLMQNPTCRFTSRSLERSLNNSLSIATIEKYIGYAHETYLSYELQRFSTKTRERVSSERKLYVVDHGLFLARKIQIGSTLPQVYENIVFVELLRRGHLINQDLFYFQDNSGCETDFVCLSKNGKTLLIQVSVDIASPLTQERELRALSSAAKQFPNSSCILINSSYSGSLENQGVPVQAIKLQDWLLQK